MNLVDEKKLEAAVIRVVPVLEAAVSRQIADASNRMALQLGGFLTGASEILQDADGKVSNLLAGLDGWTLQIEIPPITLRLTAPPQQGLTPVKKIA